MYTYEMKAVDDPFVSDRTLSLDYYYFPFIRGGNINFQIISPNFLFLESPPNEWPEKLTINDDRVLTSFVQSVIERPRGKGTRSPALRGGFLKVRFIDGTIYAHEFYTPYFNMRKVTETPWNVEKLELFPYCKINYCALMCAHVWTNYWNRLSDEIYIQLLIAFMHWLFANFKLAQNIPKN